MLLCLSLLALLLGGPALAQGPTADLILKRANIYTVDPHNPRARAVAVKGDRILFVGSDAAVQKYIGPNTRVLDLAGATVVPRITGQCARHSAGTPNGGISGTTSPIPIAITASVRRSETGSWARSRDGRDWRCPTRRSSRRIVRPGERFRHLRGLTLSSRR